MREGDVFFPIIVVVTVVCGVFFYSFFLFLCNIVVLNVVVSYDTFGVWKV